MNVPNIKNVLDNILDKRVLQYLEDSFFLYLRNYLESNNLEYDLIPHKASDLGSIGERFLSSLIYSSNSIKDIVNGDLPESMEWMTKAILKGFPRDLSKEAYDEGLSLSRLMDNTINKYGESGINDMPLEEYLYKEINKAIDSLEEDKPLFKAKFLDDMVDSFSNSMPSCSIIIKYDSIKVTKFDYNREEDCSREIKDLYVRVEIGYSRVLSVSGTKSKYTVAEIVKEYFVHPHAELLGRGGVFSRFCLGFAPISNFIAYSMPKYSDSIELELYSHSMLEELSNFLKTESSIGRPFMSIKDLNFIDNEIVSNFSNLASFELKELERTDGAGFLKSNFKVLSLNYAVRGNNYYKKDADILDGVNNISTVLPSGYYYREKDFKIWEILSGILKDTTHICLIETLLKNTLIDYISNNDPRMIQDMNAKEFPESLKGLYLKLSDYFRKNVFNCIDEIPSELLKIDYLFEYFKYENDKFLKLVRKNVGAGSFESIQDSYKEVLGNTRTFEFKGNTIEIELEDLDTVISEVIADTVTGGEESQIEENTKYLKNNINFTGMSIPLFWILIYVLKNGNEKYGNFIRRG